MLAKSFAEDPNAQGKFSTEILNIEAILNLIIAKNITINCSHAQKMLEKSLAANCSKTDLMNNSQKHIKDRLFIPEHYGLITQKNFIIYSTKLKK